MARFLVQRDGLFLGSSSAVNLVACIKLVRKMGWGNGEKVVTVLCVFSYPHIGLTLMTPKTSFGGTRV
jgi:cysteine synthase